MSSPQERIQVLYEISLSVGLGDGLRETARTALSTYLQKLNCSAGAVFERRPSQDGSVDYDPITRVPSRASVGDGFTAALERLSDIESEDVLPITAQPVDGVRYYLMALPEFGILLLVTRGRALDTETVAALRPLNEKLAAACLSERYQEQIREERDRFEAVFATIEEPLASVKPTDGALAIQRINPAFETTFGCTEQQATGQPLALVLGPNPSSAGDDQLPAVTHSGHVSVATEIRRETTDGVREFLFRSAPINPESDRTEYLVLLVDITEETERQRRLEKLNEVANVLARILRHNIRNDLTVIKSKAGHIRDTASEQIADDAETILRTSEKLASTAEKAREVRRIVGQNEPASPVALERVISRAVTNLEAKDTAGEITVEENIAAITVHPSIRVAIQHLVENGIEHHTDSATTPRVSVSTRIHDDGVSIDIRDNGPGIPDGEITMIRQNTETPLKHGSGAGLWIVNQIVEFCDAELEFSVSDEGTTVTLTVEDRG